MKYKKKTKINGIVKFEDAPYRNKDWLYEQYILQDKTAFEIAEAVGINERTLREWIQKFGLSCKFHRQEIAAAELYDLYVNQKMTTKEIGNIFGLSAGSILKRLKSLGISRRHADEYMPYWYNFKGGREQMDAINHDFARRVKSSCRQRNINIDQWQGFTHDLDTLERNSAKYLHWRQTVFERDNYTCQKCGKRGGNLEAHHIDNFHDYIDLRYDLNNGTTLCRKCHALGFPNSFHTVYGCKNNSREQFEAWIIADLDEEMDELFM